MAAAVIPGALYKDGQKDEGRFMLTERDLTVIEQAFCECDADQSGALSEGELHSMWRMVFPQMPIRELREMADSLYPDLDPNGDGYVSWPEFEKYFRGKHKDEWNEIDKLVFGCHVDRPPTSKELMWCVLDMDSVEYEDEPGWLHPLKMGTALISNTAILLSICSLVAESIPRLHSKSMHTQSGMFFRIEVVCVVVFSVEFFLRTLCTPSQQQFWISFWTFVDLFAIVPFYISIAFDSGQADLLVLRIVRLFRLLRLLRMLKVGRHMEVVQVLVISLGRTIRTLMVSMVGVNSIGIVLVASLICTAERHETYFDDVRMQWIRNNDSGYPDAGHPITFQSIPESMWWAWVTLTTVGYGDMSPSTGPGKLVASVAMLLGLVLMAFPLTLLANSFAKTMDELTKKQEAQQRSLLFTKRLQRAKVLAEEAAAMEGDGRDDDGRGSQQALQSSCESQQTLQAEGGMGGQLPQREYSVFADEVHRRSSVGPSAQDVYNRKGGMPRAGSFVSSGSRQRSRGSACYDEPAKAGFGSQQSGTTFGNPLVARQTSLAFQGPSTANSETIEISPDLAAAGSPDRIQGLEEKIVSLVASVGELTSRAEEESRWRAEERETVGALLRSMKALHQKFDQLSAARHPPQPTPPPPSPPPSPPGAPASGHCSLNGSPDPPPPPAPGALGGGDPARGGSDEAARCAPMGARRRRRKGSGAAVPAAANGPIAAPS